MILEPIYEQDFVPWSYGFRPGRSAHHALADMWEALMQMYGGWVLEVDIESFFDELDHGHLRGFLRHRVRDGALLRCSQAIRSLRPAPPPTKDPPGRVRASRASAQAACTGPGDLRSARLHPLLGAESAG